MKRKILSVDDSAIARMMIRSGVEAMGYEFLEASDGQEALVVLLKNCSKIALILLDWSMPGMNGLEFLNIIKADSRYKEVPVMVVTTETEKASIIKAIQLGVSNYLLKPFGEEELKKKITLCLAARK
ncbi:MAG: response regulator [Syntrophomonadaceae bacterium]|nr:response regulator [Syntrophomonadaceae bacterium]MDD3024379.1 response regulator [Syntrophomonadaceae bacterium]